MTPITVQAAEMRLGNILPDGAMVHKTVVSMRERRYLNMVPQETDFSCGAASLATIMKYAYGRNVTEEEVIDGLMKVSDIELVRQKGFSLLDIKHYAEQLGMRGRGYKIGLEQLQFAKIPMIALLDMRGYKHFVVISKTTRDKVYIADPSLGNRIVDIKQFSKEWNGLVFAVIGQGFDRNSVLFNPPEPLTARNKINAFHPLTDAELLDFGFIHADLI
jgi:predicted double-glycine peptidase